MKRVAGYRWYQMVANLFLQHLGINLAHTCGYRGKDITRVYLVALANAELHTLRKKVAKLVNKELGTKFRLKR